MNGTLPVPPPQPPPPPPGDSRPLIHMSGGATSSPWSPPASSATPPACGGGGLRLREGVMGRPWCVDKSWTFSKLALVPRSLRTKSCPSSIAGDEKKRPGSTTTVPVAPIPRTVPDADRGIVPSCVPRRRAVSAPHHDPPPPPESVSSNKPLLTTAASRWRRSLGVAAASSCAQPLYGHTNVPVCRAAATTPSMVARRDLAVTNDTTVQVPSPPILTTNVHNAAWVFLIDCGANPPPHHRYMVHYYAQPASRGGVGNIWPPYFTSTIRITRHESG